MNRDEYYKKHKVCPKCKGVDYEKTLVGYPFKDLNSVYCSCGFIGTVDDLISSENGVSK